MNNDDLKKIADLVDERVNRTLGPIRQQLEDPEAGLKRISERLEANTESLVTIEKAIKSYADSYKENQRNIYRLDIRLNTVEDELAIEPPEDLKVPHFAE